MAFWNGFDSGGVEQIWDDALIVQVLEVFQKNEPFDRSDEEAPFYDQLEQMFPDITWRERDYRNSFRPIFRRANPWVKLGLITPGTKNAELTTLGLEVLSGEKTLRDVYIEATSIFVENDGITRTFAIMCQAALQLPDEVFSLEDVEYAVSQDPDYTAASLIVALQKRRVIAQRFSHGSRRPRVLRRIMNSLVSAGALLEVPFGWKLASSEIAAEISGSSNSTEESEKPVVIFQKGIFAPNVKEIAPGVRPLRTISASFVARIDPIQRALLLERAHSEHERIVEKCADLIRSLGGKPIEDLNSFDVACSEHIKIIFEAKSITRTNCFSQLRKAVSQLPEYRWRHRHKFDDRTRLVIALNADPTPWVDADFLNYITEDRGISIIWLIGGHFVDRLGQSFLKN